MISEEVWHSIHSCEAGLVVSGSPDIHSVKDKALFEGTVWLVVDKPNVTC